MRKLIAMLLALAMLFCGLALAETADYLGDWYGMMYGMSIHMTLNEDGSYGMEITGADTEATEGTWEAVDGAIIMDGDDTTPFSFDGETLKATSGDEEVVFTREAPEVYVPAEAVQAQSEADFAGSWKATYISMDGMTLPVESMQNMGELEGDITAVIEGTTLTMDGFVFNQDAFEMTFADGVLEVSATAESGDFAGVTAQLLEDGTMALNLTMLDDALAFYMVKAEA